MNATKKKICFLLLPGFSPDNFPVQSLKKQIEERGHTTIASNFYGKVAIKDFSYLTKDECMQNISEIIEAAKDNYDKVFGVGISLGGAFLMEHAKNKTGLDGIISIGTPFKLKNKIPIWICQRIITVIYPIWRQLQKYEKLRLLPIGASKMVKNYLEKEFILDLEKITAPILFIHSKKDRVTDYRVLEEFSQKISSPNKKIIILENGDHVINGGSEKICQYIFEFVDYR